MEHYDFPHSMKNIPIPQRESYEKILLGKTCEFIERLRWKTFFFLNPEAKEEIIRTFGFKTARSAPVSKEIIAFEHDLWNLVTNIKYNERNLKPFEKKLKESIHGIKKSEKIFLLADKTSNIYKVQPEYYNKLLLDNITKDYKQTSLSDINKVNNEAKEIATKLRLADRMETQSECQAYITLKDHKENFKNNPKCRLINPAKSDMGKISKQLLENINKEIRESTGLQQWRSTTDVINWFKNCTTNKRTQQKFLQMDIVEFYPSISENLLDKAITFAKKISNVNSEMIQIIKHARQSFLFNKNERTENTTWEKRTGKFDVTMGAPDGAETCELVGLYILNEIKEKIPDINFGLYRDDGLAIYNEKLKPSKIDKVRKKLHSLFGEHNLRITIEHSMNSVDFLDINLDIKKQSFAPYRKPNDTPLYINIDSNHPPNVIKHVPETINKRLNTISSSKSDFDRTSGDYQKALKDSQFKYKLTYEKEINPEKNADQQENKKKKKKRKIIWFNPPYNAATSTNIGKQFLKMIEKHFPKKHCLRSIINRNCIKISYSCMKNVRSIILSHNQKVLTKKKSENSNKTQAEKEACNCRQKNKCILGNQCNTGPIVYRATINIDKEKYTYIGSTQNFKERYGNHKLSFKNEPQKYSTTLSNFIWEKKLQPNPEIKWEILRKTSIYRSGNRYCDLCLTEKLMIAREMKISRNCLNKRHDLSNRCLHKSKYRLCRV